MNAEAIICERIKRAGLLDVAERAAKRAGLLLRDCATIRSEPTDGHRALWLALHREGKTAEQIAALVGWAPIAVARVLPGFAEPTPPAASEPPPPESGPRPVTKKPAPVRKAAAPAGAKVTAPDPAIQRKLSELRVALRESETRRRYLEQRLSQVELRVIDIERRLAGPSAPAKVVPLAHENELRIVARAHGLSIDAVRSTDKTRKTLQARAEAAWRLRHLHGCTLQQIGRVLGGRDHTTVRNALRYFRPSSDLLSLLPSKTATKKEAA